MTQGASLDTVSGASSRATSGTAGTGGTGEGVVAVLSLTDERLPLAVWIPGFGFLTACFVFLVAKRFPLFAARWPELGLELGPALHLRGNDARAMVPAGVLVADCSACVSDVGFCDETKWLCC